ncbi:MAG: phospho-N-acetylmuramoyl-pentapeptide-transferase [Candidatus Riflemargulisbacteria bacterium]
MTNIILISFVLGLFLTNILINILKQAKMRQYILKDAPETHMVKEGTPTMGGLAILISALLSVLIFRSSIDFNILMLTFLLVAYALIGILDDSNKIRKKQNKGMTAKVKIILQIAFASTFAGILAVSNNFVFIQGPLQFLPPILYYVFIIFMIVGTSNAVNLTDGLDGLATGVTIISLIGFAYLAFISTNITILVFILIMIGSLLGFLWFNINPARIFMGDTGSLALGAVLAGIAILLHKELMLIPLGLIFIIETLSVILQVAYFKITKGKRIFKMSPIHHHYELCGWSENKVVLRFWIVSIIMLIIAIKIA